jgi:hypothetical protein
MNCCNNDCNNFCRVCRGPTGPRGATGARGPTGSIGTGAALFTVICPDGENIVINAGEVLTFEETNGINITSDEGASPTITIGQDPTYLNVIGTDASSASSDLNEPQPLTFISSDDSISASVSDDDGAVVDLTANGLGALKYKTYEIPLGEGNETFSVSVAEMADKNVIGIMSIAKALDTAGHTIIPVPSVSPTDDRQEMGFWVDTSTQTANIQLGDWDRNGFTAYVTFIYS